MVRMHTVGIIKIKVNLIKYNLSDIGSDIEIDTVGSASSTDIIIWALGVRVLLMVIEVWFVVILVVLLVVIDAWVVMIMWIMIVEEMCFDYVVYISLYRIRHL